MLFFVSLLYCVHSIKYKKKVLKCYKNGKSVTYNYLIYRLKYNQLERGEKITVREIFEKSGMSKLAFSRKIGMNSQTFDNRLKNEADWRISELIRIARLYDEITIPYQNREYEIKISSVDE